MPASYRLTLVVVGKDWEACDSFDRSCLDGCDLRMIANVTGEPLSRIGNRYAAKVAGAGGAPCPVLGLVHADTVFRAGSLAAFAKDAATGKVCGIVGRANGGEYRWCFENPGPVHTLDSCSVFFPTYLGLRFDEERFDSYHCHVEDLCLQAQARGIPVVVTPADATHASQIPSPAWAASYQPYRRRLTEKWGHAIWTT